MVELLRRIARSPYFGRFIVGCIVVAGILIGLECYPQFAPETAAGKVVLTLQNVIVAIFLIEVLIKIGACGHRPWMYFTAGWNVFDFAIVTVCLMPLDMRFAAVLRLARLLRALRLVAVLPRLQVLVTALLRAIPSLGYVAVLLCLHFYIYAVLGTFLFRGNDPIRFGSLHQSALTLFQVLTLEGWNDVLNTQLLGSDIHYDDAWKVLSAGARISEAQPLIAAGYFISFIMFGTWIMLSLFTGVILSSMERAQDDADVAAGGSTEAAEAEATAAALARVEQRLADLTSEVRALTPPARSG